MEFRPMSPEEIERTVQFLLHQQSQFAADFEKLSAKTDRLTDAMIGLTGIVGQMAEAQQRAAEAQQRTEHQLGETNVRVSELAEHAKIIDSHMDVLIQTFERHLREDHGRRPS